MILFLVSLGLRYQHRKDYRIIYNPTFPTHSYVTLYHLLYGFRVTAPEVLTWRSFMGLHGRHWQKLVSWPKVQLKKDLSPDSLVRLPVFWNFSFNVTWYSVYFSLYKCNERGEGVGGRETGGSRDDRKSKGESKMSDIFQNLWWWHIIVSVVFADHTKQTCAVWEGTPQEPLLSPWKLPRVCVLGGWVDLITGRSSTLVKGQMPRNKEQKNFLCWRD